ncbi:MAG TPA: di-trans,poly-cis-decaprenylcistransferase [Gammaproteobacteria bacterium]|nr:di-trans,poly-cis-decaprenylcistransferase [Gammaproteobacteria bacterium]
MNVDVPEKIATHRSGDIPLRHIAIIMDGNGRWAQKRLMPRTVGHRAGVKSVRRVIEACGQRGIEVLTLFAFSSENWRRPRKEVGTLMDLFFTALEDEARNLHESNVQLRVIGDRNAFGERLRNKIADVEALTANNSGLKLVIAANYGGRWDIACAARRLAERVRAGELDPEQIGVAEMGAEMCLADLPEPDLFIRTGGEQRISNFLLWQLTYTELYFTPVLWPDFNEQHLDEAIGAFTRRQRRFGHTGEQVEKLNNA